METPILVALIAASASVVAAVVAWRQASIAQKGARGIATTSHKVVRLDAEADQLRDDFRQFMTAVGNAHRLDDIGQMLATGEILAANPRSDAAMRAAAEEVRFEMQTAILRASQQLRASSQPLSGAAFESLQNALTDCMRSISQERESVLAETSRRSRVG